MRGLNEPSKHCPLSNWLYRRPVSFGALLETHVKVESKHHILSAIRGGWSVVTNYEFSDLGKIWVLFRAPTQVRVLFKDLQSITCDDGTVFCYTAMYASNDEDTRKELWISLRDTYASFNLQNLPWLVVGDFNEILHPDETSNANISSTTRGMRCFGDLLSDTRLFDLHWTGPKFTWLNSRPSDPIGKKLDRCLVNGCWLQKLPSSHCQF